MKRLLTILLCCALLSVSAAALAERDEALDAAFASGETIALVRADVPIAGILSGWTPLSIAPDGETILWRSGESLVITRGFASHAAKPAPERGVGDPYGVLEKNTQVYFRQLPGCEGFAWSPDSRYVLLTNKQMTLQTMRTLDLMLMDAETGEVFLAAAYNSKMMQDDAGFIYEAKFDHTGRYIYFTGRIRALSDSDALFRCDLESFEVELICENLYAVISPGLFETADGDWLVLASQTANGRSPEALYRCGAEPPNADALALYRALGLGAATVEAGAAAFRSLPINLLRSERMDYSAASGYGLMMTSSPNANQASASSDNAIATSAFLKTFQLSRITPDGAEMNQYWFLIDDSRDMTSIRLQRAEDGALALVEAVTAGASEEALEEIKAQISFTAVQIVQSHVFYVTALSASPDGYYALVNAVFEKDAALLLLNLETMEVRMVSAPEGLASRSVGTALGKAFAPGIVWQDDGTILIYNESTRTVEAYRLNVD